MFRCNTIVGVEKKAKVAQLVAPRSSAIEDGVKKLKMMIGIGREIVVLMKCLVVVFHTSFIVQQVCNC
jgi:hypothetical protein